MIRTFARERELAVRRVRKATRARLFGLGLVAVLLGIEALTRAEEVPAEAEALAIPADPALAYGLRDRAGHESSRSIGIPPVQPDAPQVRLLDRARSP